MVTCCGGLEKIRERAELPFEQPIWIEPETHNLRCDGWAVRLLNRTQSGNISRKSAGVIFLTYCPFCSAKLPEPPPEKEQDG